MYVTPTLARIEIEVVYQRPPKFREINDTRICDATRTQKHRAGQLPPYDHVAAAALQEDEEAGAGVDLLLLPLLVLGWLLLEVGLNVDAWIQAGKAKSRDEGYGNAGAGAAQAPRGTEGGGESEQGTSGSIHPSPYNLNAQDLPVNSQLPGRSCKFVARKRKRCICLQQQAAREGWIYALTGRPKKGNPTTSSDDEIPPRGWMGSSRSAAGGGLRCAPAAKPVPPGPIISPLCPSPIFLANPTTSLDEGSSSGASPSRSASAVPQPARPPTGPGAAGSAAPPPQQHQLPPPRPAPPNRTSLLPLHPFICPDPSMGQEQLQRRQLLHQRRRRRRPVTSVDGQYDSTGAVQGGSERREDWRGSDEDRDDGLKTQTDGLPADASSVGGTEVLVAGSAVLVFVFLSLKRQRRSFCLPLFLPLLLLLGSKTRAPTDSTSISSPNPSARAPPLRPISFPSDPPCLHTPAPANTTRILPTGHHLHQRRRRCPAAWLDAQHDSTGRAGKESGCDSGKGLRR
ncbi:hypothetical protein GALMADRAFT_212098 [Galerina marginata CBS 339.88]|uniref:Uncharacterized protein n=1 Tax=Galerina marginata (strain CBS 339.88) TaxID=685588 RepID=A0A067T1N2_GALM3|nr:hypothetical protein GALMADRAFT_212098 [Galerina marginata CBS 339.88]